MLLGSNGIHAKPPPVAEVKNPSKLPDLFHAKPPPVAEAKKPLAHSKLPVMFHASVENC